MNMQAMILAAGMGKRLGKFTQNQAKCMVKVAGRTLLEHNVDAIKKAGIKRLILVVGYEANKLIKFIEKNITDIEIIFVHNKDYASTNNIYSLYLAKDYLVKDDTILLESDLIYEAQILNDMLKSPDKNLVAVAKYKHWMDGTVTLLNQNNEIIDFIEKKDFRFHNASEYYKTVNIYKFSKEFSSQQYIPFLKAYIKAYGKNKYYELVLKAIAHLSSANLKAFNVEDTAWYEIDDAQDLNIANTLFAKGEEKLRSYERHFGGYWRFTDLKDFCYLVNPYYPPRRMVEHLQYFFDTLLRSYPSGMNNIKLAAAKMFKIDENQILVGNGAAELINVLGRVIRGTVALSFPAFNEYVRCFRDCNIKAIYSRDDEYELNKHHFIKMSKSCDALFIINPDNPSGSFLPKDHIIEILNACRENNTICVVDESFIDFAEQDIRYTLLKNSILKEYPNLIVIKSISKSYGVPGLRLGVLATSDAQLLKTLYSYLPVWNINSFAEYFMQINGSYEKEYVESCNSIAEQRIMLSEKLKTISFLRVYKSQANYIMCEVKSGITSVKLASKLLKEYNILIKDLSKKKGIFKKDYIRLAVKDEYENDLLYNALLSIEKEITG
jgi:histidinol-phosphate/aromatic aminotransferase/cobyric acid decarboxylase-like protein/choline kinase